MSNPILHVGVILDQPVRVGGGFQQSLSDLVWFADHVKHTGDRLTIYTSDKDSRTVLQTMGLNSEAFRIGVFDAVIFALKPTGLLDVLMSFRKFTSKFENKLKGQDVDLVYFLGPSKWALLLNDTPYIFTIYDLCHRDSPEFPEASAYGSFERRELLYRHTTGRASVIISNSTALCRSLETRYGMDADKAVCIPFSPSRYVDETQISVEDRELDGVVDGYLFYPAQFWPHKNHATLLAALSVLNQRGKTMKLVLCGSDRGARTKIEKLIDDLGLHDQVAILGFVDSDRLNGLYQDAFALVMPSYFGPTNLPPLEAWATGTPVVYPEAFRDQGGDAASYFDYDNPVSLADAIDRLFDNNVRRHLLAAGRARLQYFSERVEVGRAELSQRIERLRGRIAQISNRPPKFQQ